MSIIKITPKEKAKEIHNKFMEVQVPYNDHISGTIEQHDTDWDSAKKYALICLDEILYIYGNYFIAGKNYWIDVKKELESL